MSSSRLRLALVASLAWTLPPRQPPQQEAFDGAGGERALLRRGAAARHVIEDPGDLGAGEIGIEEQAGLGRDLVFMAGRAAARRSAAAVRRSCQTMALWIGLPVLRSHTTVVSRWLVMPMPASASASSLARASAPRQTSTVADQISSGSCSTQPGSREDLRQFLLRRRHRPARGIEHDGARAGRALVDGKDVLGGHRAFLAGFRAAAQCARSIAKSTASSRAALSGVSGKRPSASRAMAP